MKKWTALFLSFLLCALTLAPFAAAEEAYTPGAVAAQLVADSFAAGQIVTADVSLRLDADAAALGLDEEETAIFETLLPVLGDVTLRLGAGKTDAGIRVEAGAELANAQGGNPVTVNAAANLDLYGISVESDLIPGERVTSKWETLLAMAGMNDSDISTLVMLRDIDWEIMLPQVIAMAESYVQLGLQYAQPYGEIIVSWAAALPMTLDAAAAPEGYPAAAACTVLTVTAKDVLNLAAALAEHLKADTVVSGFANLLIQEAYTGEGNAPTVTQLCDEIISAAASAPATDDNVKLTLGTDESGIPVFGLVQLNIANDGSISLGASCTANAEGNADYALNFHIADTDGASLLALTCVGEAGEGLFTANAQMNEEDEQILGAQYSLTLTTPEGDLPSQKIEHTFSMALDDGIDAVQMIASGTTTAALTADGGEVMDETMNMDMFVDDTQITTTALETLVLYPDGDGFAGSYSMMQSMPQMGLDALGLDVRLSAHPYDPAATLALAETAFETASRGDIDALTNTVMQNGQYKLISAMQALPADVLMMFMNAE